MRIESMRAVFGGLEDETLTLGPGLNLITRPNEGGKSTWAGFLRAMFYGIDTRDRDKKGYLADKNRYQPWGGRAMEGEMTVLWQGRRIILRRGPKGNTPFGAFQCVDAETGEPVSGLTGDACGPVLLGVGREVYERSAFIGQGGGLAVTPAPELERRIAALAASGQEDTSHSQAAGRLREWLRLRKHNRTGLIPQLERELEEAEDTLARLDDLSGRIRALEGEREAQRRRLAALTQQQDERHREALAAQEARRRAAEEELARARDALAALERQAADLALPEGEALERARGDLAYLEELSAELRREEQAAPAGAEGKDPAEELAPVFAGLSGQEALLRAERDRAAAQAHLAEARRAKGRQTWFILAWLLLTGAGAACFFLPGGAAVLLRIPLLLLGQAVLAGGLMHCRGAVRQARARARGLLTPYGTDDPEALPPLAARHANARRQAEESALLARQASEALARKKARLESGRLALASLLGPFLQEGDSLTHCAAALTRAQELSREFEEARRRTAQAQARQEALLPEGEGVFAPVAPEGGEALAALREALLRTEGELHRLLGERDGVGDPAALAARREQCAKELERRREEYKAIEIALEALEGANAHLRERFSPALNRRAGEYFARLTGGRYRELALDREMDASVRQAEGGLLSRPALALSKGTVDQLYLAVRLAVCDLCLPGDKPPPLVLDDALVSFDDGRLSLALELLAQLGETRQILLFTCQGRESALAQAGGLTGVTLLG